MGFKWVKIIKACFRDEMALTGCSSFRMRRCLNMLTILLTEMIISVHNSNGYKSYHKRVNANQGKSFKHYLLALITQFFISSLTVRNFSVLEKRFFKWASILASTVWTTFHFSSPKRHNAKLVSIDLAALEEKTFENVDGGRTNNEHLTILWTHLWTFGFFLLSTSFGKFTQKK